MSLFIFGWGSVRSDGSSFINVDGIDQVCLGGIKEATATSHDPEMIDKNNLPELSLPFKSHLPLFANSGFVAVPLSPLVFIRRTVVSTGALVAPNKAIVSVATSKAVVEAPGSHSN